MSDDVQNPNPDEGMGDVGGDTLLGGGDTDSQVDYSTLFTPEEVKAKQESLAAAKAEEERRAALTDEERAAEDAKKADEAKKNEAPPEKYEFQLPDGVNLDSEMLDKFDPLARDLGLSQLKAQGLVDFYINEVIPQFTKQQEEAFATVKDDWKKAAIADKNFGGEKHEGYMQKAAKVMDEFQKAHPEHGANLRKAMTEYGFGSEPNLVAFVKWVGESMSEDNKVPPKSGGGEEQTGPRTFKYENTK